MTTSVTKPAETPAAGTSAASAPTGSQALGFPVGTQPGMVLGSDAFRGGLEPTTLSDAFALAATIASTRICGVTSPEDALVRILTGRSLGLSAMQALRGVYVVKGRPSLDASLMQALCMKSPLCEYFDCVASSETEATYRTKRKGREERQLTFSLEDARKQGLVDRGNDEDSKAASNYVRMPKEMLRARAKSTLARLEYPDLLFGMYSREELEAGIADEELDDVSEKIRQQEIEVEILPDSKANVQAAKRNWAAEAEGFKQQILQADSRTARAEIRAALEKWDAIEPYKSEVANFYNEHAKPKKTTTDPNGAANPAPVGDANLFGESKKS